jgi:hypothetical protein
VIGALSGVNLVSVQSEGRWWVARNNWPILYPAHPLEKSAHDFEITSIHSLSYWQVNLRGVGAYSLEKEARNVRRNVWETVAL